VATTITSFRTHKASPVSPTTSEASAISVPNIVRLPVSDAHAYLHSRVCAAELAAAERRDVAKTVKRRYQRRFRGCQAAIAMLTLRPVFTTPIPRHRVEPKAPDGTLIIHDRTTHDSFVIYSPRFVHQFHAGHQAGKWYLRPLTDLGPAPCSQAFPAAGLAVNALRAGRWSIAAETCCRSRTSPRVIWSQTDSGLPEEGR
jgi:hypothetical protein